MKNREKRNEEMRKEKRFRNELSQEKERRKEKGNRIDEE